jgi:hypothetical protein
MGSHDAHCSVIARRRCSSGRGLLVAFGRRRLDTDRRCRLEAEKSCKFRDSRQPRRDPFDPQGRIKFSPKVSCTRIGQSRRLQCDRSGTTFFGSDASNNTMQTQRRTTSLYRNSPIRFHAIGSVDRLHLTTPGVEKKNDHVIANVPIPSNDPSADRSGTNAPAMRRAAVVNSTMPSRSASPLIPKIDNHQTNGLLEMYSAIPCAD